MKIFALELSSPKGSIACLGFDEEPFSTSFANDRKHSGVFFESLQRCLDRFGNPERIVVGVGPGSYAGTRIAIATATGLAASGGAQLIGVPSFCAMETDASEYVVIGDARRQSFYFAEVRERRVLDGPHLYSEQELAERLSGISSPILSTEPLASFARAELAYPSALLLPLITTTVDMENAPQILQPIYLREPHITYPKNPSVFSSTR